MTPEALAREIIHRLRIAGYDALLVGGCVRDMLLGRPAKDFDVATSATPPKVAAIFPGSELIGAHFGVVQVRRDGATVEVATFRSDHDYQDGRHPGHVKFETDPREDVLRRDFTINALLLDPESNKLIDYVGGEQDLHDRILRTVGDPRRRFAEDHLRMLRAIRFAARLGFVIEQDTLQVIRELAPKVLTVSAERIRDELARVLTEGGARRGFELLDESGLLQQILPEIAAMKGVQQPPEFHPEGDVWVHTLIMLESMGKPPLTLALGVLLHDVAKPPTFRVADRIRFDGHAELGARMTEEIMTRLRFSHHEIEQVKALVANHMKFKDVLQMKESTLKRFLRMECFDEHLELHRIDCSSSHGNLTNWEFVREKLQDVPAEELRPPRLVTGADLIAQGYAPGPQFRDILEAVETAQLEGRLRTREDALHFVRENYGK